MVARDFENFVKQQLAWTARRTETLVPQTELWAEWNRKYVGRIAIRHELNDALRIVGGHIGYDTRPSFRGLGIASEMLRQSLPIAREIGLSKVLLTCDDSNLASIRVIEKNSGILEKTSDLAPDRPLKRYYWITL